MREPSKVLRVKYEGGVLKPLGKAELEEGKEYIIVVKDSVDELIKRYKGILGESSIKEFEELEEESQAQ